jgi:hypothetical protein
MPTIQQEENAEIAAANAKSEFWKSVVDDLTIKMNLLIGEREQLKSNSLIPPTDHLLDRLTVLEAEVREHESHAARMAEQLVDVEEKRKNIHKRLMEVIVERDKLKEMLK